MKNIIVKNKHGARNHRSDEPWIAISISTIKGEWPSITEENRAGLLQLAFYDVEFPDRGGISTDQAEQIVKFVQDHQDVDNIFVHCEAGISRSPAIAAAIANIFNAGEDKAWFQPPYIPNMLVYRAVLKAADRV